MFSPARPIYPVADIRAIENQLIPTAGPSLMERAGRAVADDAVRLIIDRPGPILIACGPGNNGGDGFVMARQLHQAGREVIVAFAGDAAALPADAAKAHADFQAVGGTLTSDLPAAPANGWALIVDALFGIGLERPVGGRYAAWIQTLNVQPAPRLALDIPSGLDSDTGVTLGTTFRATHTCTFIALKPGLLTHDGPDHCGEVSLQSLGIDPAAWIAPSGRAVTPALFDAWLQPRLRNSHKGLYGDALIVGGSAGMAGAALLAARSALRIGSGRVHVLLLDERAPAVDLNNLELMLHHGHALAPELSAHASVLAVGPGLGCSDAAAALLRAALAHPQALVLDADALNLLAVDPALQAALRARSGTAVLTPHPGEAGRLLGTDSAGVQRDRVHAALELARRHGAHVVLKGCGSVVAMPDGRWFINESGNAGMASAGMGDVLTGMVAGLLAQGWPACEALLGAVHLHGAAAQRLALAGIGPVGLSAGETIAAARAVFNGWIAEAQGQREPLRKAARKRASGSSSGDRH